VTPEIETPIGHRELIKLMKAQQSATRPTDGRPWRSCLGDGGNVAASWLRHEMTGQFYALSHEDAGLRPHCNGIIEDLKPETANERCSPPHAEDQCVSTRPRSQTTSRHGMSAPSRRHERRQPESTPLPAGWLATEKPQMLSLYGSDQRSSRRTEGAQQLQRTQSGTDNPRRAYSGQLAIVEGGI